MNQDMEDILICYAKLFSNNDIDKGTAKKLLKYSKKLIKRGWREDQITRRFCIYHKNKGKNISINSMFNSLFKGKTPPFKKEDNLLEDKIYYHKELRKTPKNRRNINVRNYKVEIDNPPFYMFNVEEYKLEDMLKYYMNKVDNELINNRLKNYNRKVLKNTSEMRDIDLILFTIDYMEKLSKNSVIDFPSSASKLMNHFQDGRKYYNNVKNNMSDDLHPFYKAYLKMIDKEGDSND